VDPPVSSAPLPGPDRPASSGGSVAEDDIQREKLILLGRMASNLAHEIRNPLATIVATSQSLLAWWTLPGLADAEGPAAASRSAATVTQLREDLHLVIEEARRAGELVGGLLSFARRREDWGPVAIEDVVRRVAALCRHSFLVDDVELVEPAPVGAGLAVVLGSANQLQQILLNLVVNARQAMTAARCHGQVRIGLQVAPEAGVVTLLVEDDGPGVPAELREVVFEPFFTTKTADGTGLGLYICRGIAQAHGGTLGMEERPDGGARFVLALPRAALAVCPEPRRQSDERPAGEERRRRAPAERTPVPAANIPARQGVDGPAILLVDDEDGLRRVVARYLRRCGYRVEEASSGRAAVTAIGAGTFAAVVSDLRMPGFSGMDLFNWAQRERPELVPRFVFTSGDTLSGESGTFLARAGRPVLQKPFELAALREVLTEVSGTAAPRLAAQAGA
jgi:two-component system NtrC family sensor kinase